MSLAKAIDNQHSPMKKHSVELNHNCVEMSATNSTVNAIKNPIGVFQLNGHLKYEIASNCLNCFFLWLQCSIREYLHGQILQIEWFITQIVDEIINSRLKQRKQYHTCSVQSQ